MADKDQHFELLSELWATFHRVHAPAIYVLATRLFAGPSFPKIRFHSAVDEFGSPMDLVEREFFGTLRPFEIQFVRDGEIIGARSSRDPVGDMDVFARMSVFESTIEANEADEASASWHRRMGGRHFEKWPHLRGDARNWGERYPKLVSQGEAGTRVLKTPYHRLPIFYERHAFCIPEETPPWNEDLLEADSYSQLQKRFAGCAMALTEGDTETWRRSVIPGGSLVARWRRDGLGAQPKGRPRKIEQALVYFDRVCPRGKGSRTWDAVVAEIVERFGFTVSKKVLSDAVNAREKDREKSN